MDMNEISQGDSSPFAEYLDDADEHVRAWAVRLGMDWAYDISIRIRFHTAEILTRAAKDTSIFVRTAIIGEFQRKHYLSRFFEFDQETQFLLKDPNALRYGPEYAKFLWYGLEQAVAHAPTKLAPLIPEMTVPLWREYSTRRLLEVPADELANRLKLVTSLLAGTTDDSIRADILTGMRDALAGVNAPPLPWNWPKVYETLAQSKSEAVYGLADELGVKFGDERAMTLLGLAIYNDKLDPARRRTAIARLAPAKRPEMGEAFRHLLADPAVRGAAIKALANYADSEIPNAILKYYSSFTTEEKSDAVLILSGRREWSFGPSHGRGHEADSEVGCLRLCREANKSSERLCDIGPARSELGHREARQCDPCRPDGEVEGVVDARLSEKCGLECGQGDLHQELCVVPQAQRRRERRRPGHYRQPAGKSRLRAGKRTRPECRGAGRVQDDRFLSERWPGDYGIVKKETRNRYGADGERHGATREGRD